MVKRLQYGLTLATLTFILLWLITTVNSSTTFRVVSFLVIFSGVIYYEPFLANFLENKKGVNITFYISVFISICLLATYFYFSIHAEQIYTFINSSESLIDKESRELKWEEYSRYQGYRYYTQLSAFLFSFLTILLLIRKRSILKT